MSNTGRLEDRADRAGAKTAEWAGRAAGEERLEAEGSGHYDAAEVRRKVRRAFQR